MIGIIIKININNNYFLPIYLFPIGNKSRTKTGKRNKDIYDF